MAKKKLDKRFKEDAPSVIQITVLDGEQDLMEFDFNDLPLEIQGKLGPFGLSHKLGDAAAGKSGKEAEEAIIKVFEGLMENNWSVRAPAAPKVSTKTIKDNLSTMSEDEQSAAAAVLKKLGINIPGLTDEE
jgi:hypothetical protein